MVFLNPQPGDEELASLPDSNRPSAGDSEKKRQNGDDLARGKFYFSEIRRYRGLSTGRLLLAGLDEGDLAARAEKEGWQVTQQNGDLKNNDAGQFDLCILSNALERSRSPLAFLKEIHQMLKPGGTLFITAPSTDSPQARLMQKRWPEFKAEHLAYFDKQTIQTALFIAGFRDLIVQSNGMNGLMAFSKKVEVRPQEVLSVIVPAFNEAATLGVLMESLLQKELPNLQLEIIVVESNSTDGTREIALKFQNHPRVTLVLEDAPRGKGHAVRVGLKVASGDYVLIQDADLEYDLEDYDALVGELVAGRHAFVLGSRHGGQNVMKMRQFTGQRSLSLIFNTGHWFFTALINVLFLQRLRDPFTMFKVFRRDCLCGLELECDRFDFDYELLVKLIRKGYRPVELPVNYRSRSYSDGKKVRMFRDPLSWLKVLVWLRWIKIDPMATVEKTRLSLSGQESSASAKAGGTPVPI
ncbi:MAG TPA: glycosyltransferase [Verrucomicrobiae bacterium]|jgi:glycosyltransferase involved in cell wall biosynthesis